MKSIDTDKKQSSGEALLYRAGGGPAWIRRQTDRIERARRRTERERSADPWWAPLVQIGATTGADRRDDWCRSARRLVQIGATSSSRPGRVLLPSSPVLDVALDPRLRLEAAAGGARRGDP